MIENAAPMGNTARLYGGSWSGFMAILACLGILDFQISLIRLHKTHKACTRHCKPFLPESLTTRCAFRASAIMDRKDADVDFLPPDVSGFFVTYSLIFPFLRKSIETLLRFSTNDDRLKHQIRPRHVPPKACLPCERTLGLV